jgi:hypothetical protein
LALTLGRRLLALPKCNHVLICALTVYDKSRSPAELMPRNAQLEWKELRVGTGLYDGLGIGISRDEQGLYNPSSEGSTNLQPTSHRVRAWLPGLLQNAPVNPAANDSLSSALRG